MKTPIKVKETIVIKISNHNVELELNANEYTWSLYCNQDDFLEFSGSVFNGHYNYNGKEIIMYVDSKEFNFFRQEIKTKIEKILKKNKILKK